MLILLADNHLLNLEKRSKVFLLRANLLTVFSRFFTTFALKKIKTIQKLDNKRTRTTYSSKGSKNRVMIW